MIVYNHYIKFIPELKNVKKVEGSFVDTVIVQESISNNLEDILKFELTFFNNQDRDLMFYTDREFSRAKKGQLWAFEVKGVVTFFWYSETLRLEYVKHDSFTEELLEYWCLHIVLPIFFTVEEIFVFLHAGAVEVEGKPIFFIAPSMGGKSIMTDYFIKQGHQLISDDKVPTFIQDGKFMAVGSHPYHRPYRKFEELGYRVDDFTTGFKPIHAFYELEGVEGDAEITIEEIKGFTKFDALLPNYLYMFSWLKPERLNYLSKMLNDVRVFHVKVPWDIQRLGKVHDMICEHSKDIE